MHQTELKRKGKWWLAWCCVATTLSLGGGIVYGQRAVKRPARATPPTFKPGEFSGVFFDDAVSQLQGPRPEGNAVSAMADGNSGSKVVDQNTSDAPAAASGNDAWKVLISSLTTEDLIKESKSRLDKVITTPAKFAGGGFKDARREFTLIATLMAIIKQYPDDIRFKNSSEYGHKIFARMAANCKVGTQPVYNEAKLRFQDLQDLLKGSKLSGNADEVTWEDTADRGPVMQLLEWSLRENLAPGTSNAKEFQNSQEDILKYAELVAAFGQVLQQDGMTDADDDAYKQLAAQMVNAATEAAKAIKRGDIDTAQAAVGKIDQSCNKCHESYR